MELKDILKEERISVDVGIDAYLESGLEPLFGSWRSDGKACALKAVGVACAIDDEDSTDSTGWIIRGLGEQYASGFTAAFDGVVRMSPARLSRPDGERYAQGFQDGRKLRDAIENGVLKFRADIDSYVEESHDRESLVTA